MENIFHNEQTHFDGIFTKIKVHFGTPFGELEQKTFLKRKQWYVFDATFGELEKKLFEKKTEMFFNATFGELEQKIFWKENSDMFLTQFGELEQKIFESKASFICQNYLKTSFYVKINAYIMSEKILDFYFTSSFINSQNYLFIYLNLIIKIF